jgi:GTP cyclohydrolase II
VLLYLRQEGRGIGLANKLRAYALQDRGLDTVDANRRSALPTTSATMAWPRRCSGRWDSTEVRVLTNNPNKIAGLSRRE